MSQKSSHQLCNVLQLLKAMPILYILDMIHRHSIWPRVSVRFPKRSGARYDMQRSSDAANVQLIRKASQCRAAFCVAFWILAEKRYAPRGEGEGVCVGEIV